MVARVIPHVSGARDGNDTAIESDAEINLYPTHMVVSRVLEAETPRSDGCPGNRRPAAIGSAELAIGQVCLVKEYLGHPCQFLRPDRFVLDLIRAYRSVQDLVGVYRLILNLIRG